MSLIKRAAMAALAVDLSSSWIVSDTAQAANDSKAWQYSETLDDKVPGYQVANLKFPSGSNTIQRFVNASERHALRGAGASKSSSSSRTTNVIRVAGNSRKSNGGISEKEAFDSAKELGTIEGWEAFLNSFSTGFRADLARAYVKRLAGAGGTTTPTRQPKRTSTPSKRKSASDKNTPLLDTFEARLGTTPWRSTRYEMDEGNYKAKAAAVKGNGVELLFHCDGKRLAGILRESGRNLYPNFDRRIEQGLTAKRNGRSDGEPVPIPFEFSNGRNYSVGAQVMEMNGEVSLTRHGDGRGFKADGSILADLMSEDFVTISAPPFVANLQLKNSRPALCSLIRSCGAEEEGCGSTTKTYTSKPSRKSKQYKAKKRRKSRRALEAAACRDIGMAYIGGQCQPKSKKVRQRAKKLQKKPCPAGMYRNPYGQCQPNETGG